MKSTIKFLPKLKEECGVFGIINQPNASHDIYMGLHALQHRGQEASGIVTLSSENKVFSLKKKGSVVTSFDKEDVENLVGDSGIGHVRYSTFGGSSLINIQPFIFNIQQNIFATCHNGNIVNAKELKSTLSKQGSIFFSFSDSEILGHLISCSSKKQVIDKIIESLQKLEGAFTFLILTKDKLYGCRDRNGIRPLVLGKKGNSFVFASETVALDIIGAEFVRDVEPGEIVTADSHGKIESHFYPKKDDKIGHNMCAMEYIYFSRPDNILEGQNVHDARMELGKQLAKEHLVPNADVVIGVPDSSLSCAIGYSQASNIPYNIGLVKNKYIGRSFIAPSQTEREKMAKMKLNPNKSVLKDKVVVLVDDSIVRGTTMEAIIKLIHNAGAKEIHVRISAPELKWPCFYGVDISTKKELAMNKFTKEKYIETLHHAKSLEFLSLAGLQTALKRSSKDNKLCTSCFTGKYVTKLFSNKDVLNG